MIRKPLGTEQESKAHAAVGRAIEVGGEVKQAAQKGSRLAGIGCMFYLALAMGFGLIMSSTPWWFKAGGLLILFVLYRMVKALYVRR